MKKLNAFIMLALILTTSLSVSCKKDKEVDIKKTPKAVQDFVSTHFPNVDVLRAFKDYDDATYTWEIDLVNGFELEFNKSGEWTNIDGKTLAVPASILALLPQSIITYCTTNYPNQFIVQIEKENKTYEIKLQNNVELVFDLDGKFLRVDD
jgi:hypothetical protein